jgi:hypothetical protein
LGFAQAKERRNRRPADGRGTARLLLCGDLRLGDRSDRIAVEHSEAAIISSAGESLGPQRNDRLVERIRHKQGCSLPRGAGKVAALVHALDSLQPKAAAESRVSGWRRRKQQFHRTILAPVPGVEMDGRADGAEKTRILPHQHLGEPHRLGRSVGGLFEPHPLSNRHHSSRRVGGQI